MTLTVSHCLVPGCTQPTMRPDAGEVGPRVLCAQHSAEAAATCTCGRAVVARGLCATCYQRQRRRDAGAVPRNATPVMPAQHAVRVSAALDESLRAISTQQRVPIAEVLRRAALYYLSHGAPPNVPEMADDD